MMELVMMAAGFLFKYLLPEYFAAKKEARSKDREFKLDQQRWAELVEKSLFNFRANLRKDSGGAGTIDDQMDNR